MDEEIRFELEEVPCTVDGVLVGLIDLVTGSADVDPESGIYAVNIRCERAAAEKKFKTTALTSGPLFDAICRMLEDEERDVVSEHCGAEDNRPIGYPGL